HHAAVRVGELSVEARQLFLLALELEQRGGQLAVLLPELGEIALGHSDVDLLERVADLPHALRTDDRRAPRQRPCERHRVRPFGPLIVALEQPFRAQEAVPSARLPVVRCPGQVRARHAHDEPLGQRLTGHEQLDDGLLLVLAERCAHELRDGGRDADLVVMLEAEQAREVARRLPHGHGVPLLPRAKLEQRSHGLTTTAATSSLPRAKSRYSSPATKAGWRSQTPPRSAGCQRVLIPSLCMTRMLPRSKG